MVPKSWKEATVKPSANAYGANSSGSAFRRRFQRSKVKRIRASVVAQPQQRQRSDAGVHLGGGLGGLPTSPSE